MGTKYIVIPNWSKFQHYKDRDPKWIKNYTRLLVDNDYLGLTASRRALLHGLWLAYAQTVTSEGLAEDLPRTCLRLDVEMLNRRLGLAAKMADYESLNHAGFIHIVASNGLADWYGTASPDLDLEVEVEEKPKPMHTPSYEDDNPDIFAPPQPNGRHNPQPIAALITQSLQADVQAGNQSLTQEPEEDNIW